MSFSQHLVLWLHVAFVIFTIGPATTAIMSTPRYIRRRDIRIVRYLSRETLFLVTIVLLGLIQRDQRRAIKALEAATDTAAHVGAPAGQVRASADQPGAGAGQPPGEAAADPQAQPAGPPDGTGPRPAAGPQGPQPVTGSQPADPAAIPAHLATVERGRIAMIGGVVTVIWLVILVLMVWNG